MQHPQSKPRVAPTRFRDRSEAGRLLAERMQERGRWDDAVVLGLPRGGVPVAAAVAQALGAPLDVLLVRKLGVPTQPELALGAIAAGGAQVLDQDVIRPLAIDEAWIERVSGEEARELERRERIYREGRPPLTLAGALAILVDDGVATGSTMRAAIRSARALGARRVVVATPVIDPHVADLLREEAEDLVSVLEPRDLRAISLWYDEFPQLSDEEVRAVLQRVPVPSSASQPLEEVRIPVNGFALTGDLGIPRAPRGLVLFAHGSGSSRHSRRNREVAAHLRTQGLATLLLDLLTPEEEAEDIHARSWRFDIPLLSQRLIQAVDTMAGDPRTAGLPIGLFGASTGAAAAIIAAARRSPPVACVVSRGGRPDLAQGALHEVRIPVLLIVGGEDQGVLRLNRSALSAIPAPGALEVIPGATHLFEEPGALEAVAQLAAGWFRTHLATPPPGPATGPVTAQSVLPSREGAPRPGAQEPSAPGPVRVNVGEPEEEP